MTRAYYKGAVGAIIVFDQSDARTFHAAMDRWKTDLDAKVNLPGSGGDNKKLPVVLVCNKCDLSRDSRLPNDLDISTLVQERGFVPKWIKTSAKTGEGVTDAFKLVVRYVMAMDDWNSPMMNPDEAETSFESSAGLDMSYQVWNHSTDGSDEAALEALSANDEEGVVVLNKADQPQKSRQCYC